MRQKSYRLLGKSITVLNRSFCVSLGMTVSALINSSCQVLDILSLALFQEKYYYFKENVVLDRR